MSCQACGSRTKSILDLGSLPLCNDLRVDAPAHPLDLHKCTHCELVQIDNVLPKETVFPPSYPYRSAMAMDFSELTQEVLWNANDWVVDIGCNDGTFLKTLKGHGLTLLGIDPTDAIDDAVDDEIETAKDYFTAALASKWAGCADVITASNVFAHMPDLSDVIKGIKKMLTPNGIFISENHYFGDLVTYNQWDTIYHEHLRYYTVKALVYILGSHGLRVYNVQPCASHGGSIRVFTDLGARPVAPAVHEYIEREANFGAAQFQARVMDSAAGIKDLLRGKQAFGIGAPSRAGTLVSFCGLTIDDVAAVAELSGSPKVGQCMPGTDIPIVDEGCLYLMQPEYAVVFSWHIADRIMKNVRTKGFNGKFILPLPTPRIVG